jgi:biotin transport system ATP-binding protein/energy-coupling factor transport system ATP-binding protein
MITFNDVHYRYDLEKVEALRGISLEIRDGEHVALIGPNGCGKTTFIRHLNALLLPTSGRVLIDELDTADIRTHALIRSQVGMVFQNPESQIIGMTVEEDVAFGPENLGLPPGEIKTRVIEALNRIGIADLTARSTETLSGGEKRLVAIAGVLAMRPRYIAFDEPTAFLDPKTGKNILQIIDQLYGEDIGIIHITHNMSEAAMASRVIVLNAGRVSLDGTPQEVFSKVDILKEIGMQLPPITELLIRLQEIGFPVRTDIINLEDAVEQIKLAAKVK